MHCSWEDVNLSRSTVTVRYKPEYGFSPKNYREREIPIPTKLVKSLKASKAKSDKAYDLVFPTAGCKPKLESLGNRLCRASIRVGRGHSAKSKHLDLMASSLRQVHRNSRRLTKSHYKRAPLLE